MDWAIVMSFEVGLVTDAEALGTRPPQKEGPNAVGFLAVINGVLAGAGSVYLTTQSVWITLLAAVSAVILGGLDLIVPW